MMIEMRLELIVPGERDVARLTDLAAVAGSTVDALTIVLGSGVVASRSVVWVNFYALNTSEATMTARHVLNALSHEASVDHASLRQTKPKSIWATRVSFDAEPRGHDQDSDVLRERYENERDATCQWFALCGNEATGTMPHPTLGDVPICDRCRAKVERLA